MSQEPPSGRRRLTKSHDRKLGGVAGGLAEYFEIDPTLVRVLWVVALFLPPIGGGAAVAYIIMWFVMPDAEGERPASPRASSSPSSRRGDGEGVDGSLLVGIIIVAVGLMLLLRQSWVWMPFWGWAGFSLFWPLALILLGAWVIYSARRN